VYKLEISDKPKKIFFKLLRRNPAQLEIIDKKILEIRENPFHYKPLRGDMKGLRRIHIDKSFVLTYEIVDDTVRIIDYDHHDKVHET